MSDNRIKYLICIIFITLMAIKVPGVVTFFLPGDAAGSAREMLVDMEKEEEKKGGRLVEIGASEDFFEEPLVPVSPVTSFSSLSLTLLHTVMNLPNVCLDIPTPPPNRLVA